MPNVCDTIATFLVHLLGEGEGWDETGGRGVGEERGEGGEGYAF